MPLDELYRELVGFAGSSTITDADELDPMLFREHAQRMQAAVPVVARHVGVDSGGVHQFASAIHYGHFHASTQARVQPHGHAVARRCCQQQVVQVGGEHANGFGLRSFAQCAEQFHLQLPSQLHAPCPARGLHEPSVGFAATRFNAIAPGNAQFAFIRWLYQRFGVGQVFGQLDGGAQKFFVATAEKRKRTVRCHA